MQDAVGGFAGDAETQVRVKINQARGQAESALGDASDMIREQPLVAGLAILAIGYLLGRLRIL